MPTGLYQIVHLITGQRYVGSSVNIEHRFTRHRYFLRRNQHSNQYLQRDWNTYGETYFAFSIVAIVERADQVFFEQRWLDYLLEHAEGIYNILYIVGKTRSTHGLAGSKEYKVWNTMVQRCTNPRHKNFNDYGGRGITVDPSWRNFSTYYKDMGPRPPGGMIERRDNDGPYSPENCYWATRMQQAKNKRNTRLITAHGETKHLAEWARELGSTPGAITYRLTLGWSPEDAVSIPVDGSVVTAIRGTPAWRAAQSARRIAYYADPAAHVKASVVATLAMARPEVQQKVRDGLKKARDADPLWGARHSEKMRGRTLSEEHKAKIREGTTRALADPAIREKISQGVIAAKQRKKLENLEQTG